MRLFWRGGDQAIIDRFGPDGIAQTTLFTTNWVVRFQSGFLYQYALVMMIGVALIISYFMIVGVR